MLTDDADGMALPASIAPFAVVVTPVNSSEPGQRRAGEEIYQTCLALGLESSYRGVGGMRTWETASRIWQTANALSERLNQTYVKAMAALIADVRAGRYKPGSTVVFIHTGGAPAIFAEPEKVLPK